jgi:hypothetical protein
MDPNSTMMGVFVDKQAQIEQVARHLRFKRIPILGSQGGPISDFAEKQGNQLIVVAGPAPAGSLHIAGKNRIVLHKHPLHSPWAGILLLA